VLGTGAEGPGLVACLRNLPIFTGSKRVLTLVRVGEAEGESISLSDSDHPFKGYDQKCNSSKHVYHWMRRSKFRVKIIAASDMESD